MEKMGWKEGQGLGRQKQGITAPLVARKTDRHSGVIILGQTPPPGIAKAKAAAATEVDALPTSRVLLLTNLVGPGEVDGDLEGETAEEASKYGNLKKVKILEIKGVPAEEAVRIFLKYEKPEEAVKAYNDLNGRFFGGRTVRARFFDEQKFEDEKLAPEPDE
eukprot:GHVL01002849.1.p2 GENE.GHVL01002849.1~~GHVL01002849.1.p2  ORF type:complete len:162 (+),score=40.03 GHVL01002849.1:562-1047(+)